MMRFLIICLVVFLIGCGEQSEVKTEVVAEPAPEPIMVEPEPVEEVQPKLLRVEKYIPEALRGTEWECFHKWDKTRRTGLLGFTKYDVHFGAVGDMHGTVSDPLKVEIYDGMIRIYAESGYLYEWHRGQDVIFMLRSVDSDYGAEFTRIHK